MEDDQITPPPGYENYTPLLDTSKIKPPKGYENYKLLQKPEAPQFKEGMGTPIKDIIDGFPEAAAQHLPMIGALAGPEGIAAGSFAKQALQGYFPKLFGEGPQDLTDVATNTGTDMLTQHLIPKAIGKLFSSIPGVRNAINADRDTMATKLESQRVNNNADTLEKNFLESQSPMDKTVQNWSELDTVPSKESTTQRLKQTPETGRITDRGILLDPGKQVNFSKSYNDVIRKGQEEINSLIYKGYSPTTKSLDAPKILDEMIQNPESYSNIDPIKKNSLKEFLTAVSKQKPIEKTTADEAGNILSYAKKRLTFDLAPILLGAASGHMEVGAMSAGAMIVTDKLISKWMENPAIAHLAIRAVKTGFDSPESPLVSRVLMYALRGTEVTLLAPDGKEEKATIDNQGNPVAKK